MTAREMTPASPAVSPKVCPECGLGEYDCEREGWEGDTYLVHMRCYSLSCQAKWVEVYAFQSFTVEPFDPPDRFD